MQKHEKVPFGVSVMCRSMKKFHLVFLSCAEARKSFIWCFCHVQKHEKVSFGVSDVCRSMKKVSFGVSDVCRSMKKVSFGVSDVSRSAKKFHLVFLKRSEA